MRDYQIAGLLIVIVMVTACATTVTVRSSSPLKNVTINHEMIGDVDEEGRDIALVSGLGPLAFTATNAEGARVNGVIERTQFNSWAVIGSAVGTLLALPAMIFFGTLIANPQWRLLSSDHAQNMSGNSSFSYMRHSLSTWTIPITAIFAVIGTAPLLGLLKSKRVASGTIDLW